MSKLEELKEWETDSSTKLQMKRKQQKDNWIQEDYNDKPDSPSHDSPIILGEVK